MGAFDVEAPNWGRIAPVAVTGAPVVHTDGSVSFATDAGPLRVSLLETGARLRLGPDPRDSGILVREPATLAARTESDAGDTRIVAGERVLEIGHLGRLGEVYARQGRNVQALEVVDQLKAMAASRYVSPTLVALIYARLGDTGAAFQWLAKAKPGDGPTIDDAGFASLRGDPRFEAARHRLLPNPECISL